MKEVTDIIQSFHGRFLTLLVVLLLVPNFVEAQEVKTSIDTTEIRMGEQITYGISVAAEEEAQVVFPEGEDLFLPLEVVESLAPDTIRTDGKYELLKEYALTLWDSGHYTIPRQKVLIDSREFFTDSLEVMVYEVPVDTTVQKMYPIKPAVEIPSRFTFPVWGWWVLALLILVTLIYLFLRRRRKKAEAAKNLPPYEQAIFELQQLDESHLLDNREIKEYYSQLSSAVRRYLDGDVYNRAMESTTGELITYLEGEKNSGKLNIDEQTIENLKQILQRADLVKFANSRPDLLTAKEDRSKAEFVIKDTRQGIPQPTEEELLQDQMYRERKERKRRKKNLIISIAIVIGALVATTVYFASSKGVDYVVDFYFGNESKDLLEGDWINSEYGTPPVSISTPEVLKRGQVNFPESVKTMMSGSQSFLFGDLHGNFFISLTTMDLHKQSGFELNTVVEGVYEYLESRGASNILLKEEDFVTRGGTRGIKIFGSMYLKDPESGNTTQKEYTILNFAQNGGYQQIILAYDTGDDYAMQITERIQSSIELKNDEADVQ